MNLEGQNKTVKILPVKFSHYVKYMNNKVFSRIIGLKLENNRNTLWEVRNRAKF